MKEYDDLQAKWEGLKWRLIPKPGGAVTKPTPVTPPATGIEIRLPTTSSLSGRIEGVAGEEATQWRVRLYTANGTQLARARLDDKGAWTAPAVPDANDVWVAATARQGDRYALAGPLRAAGQTITMQIKDGVDRQRIG